MKKIAAVLLCFCLLCTCSVTAFAQTVDETGTGGAKISVTVPDSHQITVSADHAAVSIDGQTGSSLTVGRLSEPRLLIRPDSGYRVIKVTLNGEDITDAVVGGYYTLAAVYEDLALAVETEAVTQSGDSTHIVSGTITDENGDPVPGATVDIGGHTGVTDENGDFTIEGVPDGYHPVTVTDSDGNVIGYTEIEIGKGDTADAGQNENGGYTVTAPADSNFSIDMTVTEDGRLTVENVQDVTPKPDDGKAPQTGDNSNIALWIAIMLAAGAAMIGTVLYNRKRKYCR